MILLAKPKHAGACQPILYSRASCSAEQTLGVSVAFDLKWHLPADRIKKYKKRWERIKTLIFDIIFPKFWRTNWTEKYSVTGLQGQRNTFYHCPEKQGIEQIPYIKDPIYQTSNVIKHPRSSWGVVVHRDRALALALATKNL